MLFICQGSLRLTFETAEKEGVEPSRRFSRPTPFPGEPLRPLGYFSKICQILFVYYIVSAKRTCDKQSGEDGIRTHAPFRTNGFQDRLVMTTSIPLQWIHFSSVQGIFYQIKSLMSIRISLIYNNFFVNWKSLPVYISGRLFSFICLLQNIS